PSSSIDPEWLSLRLRLWPHAKEAELLSDMADTLARGHFVRLAFAPGGSAIGLVEASQRVDYVNGTSTSPVAFLEGLYVEPMWRRKGVARAPHPNPLCPYPVLFRQPFCLVPGAVAVLVLHSRTTSAALIVSVVCGIAGVVLGFSFWQVRRGHWQHVDASARAERRSLNLFLAIVLFLAAGVAFYQVPEPGLS